MIFLDIKFTNHHQRKTCRAEIIFVVVVLIDPFYFCFIFHLLPKYRPMIADLNCPGEVITLIDPNADVIKDPAVQRIFKSLDGERTVVINQLTDN